MKKEISVILFVLSVGHFVNHITLGAIPALFPLIRQELSLTYTQVGILGTVSAFVTAIANYLSGRLSDIKKEEKIIGLGLIILGISESLTSYIRGFYDFFITRIIEGVGSGGWHPPVSSYLSKKFSRENLGFAFSIQGSAGIFGSAIAPLVAVPFALSLGWRVGILLIGSISILTGLFIVFVLLKPRIREFKASDVNYNNINSSGNNVYDVGYRNGRTKGRYSYNLFVILMILIIIARISAFRTITYFTSLLLNDIGSYSPTMAGLLSSVVLGFGAVGGLIGGKVTDKFSSLTTLRFSTLFSGILFIFSFIFLQNILIMLSIVTLIFFIGMPGVESYVMKVAPSKKRGETYGIIFSVGPVFGAFSLTLFGYVADVLAPSYIFIIVGVVLLVGSILTVKLPSDFQILS
ncbi:MAG: MFS transporter [Candidatus Asgardarchaeia archaeon]